MYNPPAGRLQPANDRFCILVCLRLSTQVARQVLPLGQGAKDRALDLVRVLV